jgi:drug/metabolite transporter (DMT)-like permease
MIALSYNNKQSIHIGTYISAVLLNFGMLYTGYLGEKDTISKTTGCIVGFIFFAALFALIYFTFVKGSSKTFNFILFGIYLFIWGLYGFVYLLDEENKNIIYNILDVTAKSFVGLGLWTYFTKILVI